MKSRTFPGLSRTFSGKFKGLLYQIKPTILEKLHYSVYWFCNELHKICFWKIIKPPFTFSNIVTSNVLCPIVTSSSFWLLFAIKGEKCRPFQDFQGPQPKFKDFSGPRFFFLFFFCQFQDFPGFSRTVATLTLLQELLRTTTQIPHVSILPFPTPLTCINVSDLQVSSETWSSPAWWWWCGVWLEVVVAILIKPLNWFPQRIPS